jgi:hypothetical protein
MRKHMTEVDFAVVYFKYLKGATIDDCELTHAIVFAKSLQLTLRHLGERFHFAWAEIRRFCEVMETYQQARKKGKKC